LLVLLFSLISIHIMLFEPQLMVLQNFPVFKQCEVTYVPIFLGGLMKMCGNTAPINIKSQASRIHLNQSSQLTSIPDKDKWIGTERLRWARLFDVPMTEKMPDGFPPNTISVSHTVDWTLWCLLIVRHRCNAP